MNYDRDDPRLTTSLEKSKRDKDIGSSRRDDAESKNSFGIGEIWRIRRDDQFRQMPDAGMGVSTAVDEFGLADMWQCAAKENDYENTELENMGQSRRRENRVSTRLGQSTADVWMTTVSNEIKIGTRREGFGCGADIGKSTQQSGKSGQYGGIWKSKTVTANDKVRQSRTDGVPVVTSGRLREWVKMVADFGRMTRWHRYLWTVVFICHMLCVWGQYATSTTVAYVGETVTIDCPLAEIYAYPDWITPDGTPLTINDSSTINPAVSDSISYADNSRDLLLTNVTTADAGTYICINITRSGPGLIIQGHHALHVVVSDCTSPPNIPNARPFTQPTATYNTTLEVTCDQGFELNGHADYITCQADGNWTEQPTCNITHCTSPPNITNASPFPQSTAKYNTTLNVTCDPGFEISGDVNYITCQADKNWTEQPTCSIAYCTSPPNIPNASPFPQSTATYNTTLNVTCDPGFEISGDANYITCQDDGNWTAQPTCNITDCGLVTSPHHGSAIYPSPCPDGETACTSGQCTLVGCEAAFTCDTNYHLSGHKSATCDSSGSWDKKPPKCHQTGLLSQPSLATETSITGTDDQYLAKIKFDIKIPIFDQLFDILYICPNGILSFNKEYESYTVPASGKEDNDFKKRNLIALYHTDIDLTTSGFVLYKLVDTTTDQLAADIDAYVQRNEKIAGYKSVVLFKATWVDAPQYGSSQTATFQVLLTSDGDKTFAYLFYGQDKMKYNFGEIFIGYTFGSNYFYREKNSADGSYLYNSDSNLVSFNWRGSVRFSLTPVGLRIPNYAAMCKKWHTSELANRTEYQAALKKMPICPCEDSYFEFDRRFVFVRWWELNTETYTTTLVPSRAFSPHAKTCTYNTWWGFFVKSGTPGHFIKSNPEENQLEHERDDLYWKDICCTISKADRCDLFYDVRPVSTDCYTIIPFTIGRGFGDPHVETIDGVTYTFNGLGEFLLLNAKDAATSTSKFVLQSRTEKAVTADGRLTDATVYSAFAVAVDGATTPMLKVELNPEKTNLIVFAGGVDYTTDYQTTADFSLSTLDVHLNRYDNVLVAYFPSVDISLNVTVGVGMLTMSITVSNEFRGHTEGMLGNFNGDKNDDYMHRGSTVPVAGPITDRKIYEMGKTWTITEEESLFKPYPQGYTYADFVTSHVDFEPIFLDEANQTLVELAKSKCGQTNIPCIYDFVLTGSEKVAEATKNIEVLAAQTSVDLLKMSPTVLVVSGTTEVNDEQRIFVTIGSSVTYIVNGSDDTPFQYKFLTNTVGATIGTAEPDGAVPITFTLTNSDPQSISLTVEDSDGSIAPSVDVVMVLCSGCSNHGNCDYNALRTDTRTTEFFKYSTCNCDAYFEGDDCELDKNGCDLALCGAGRTCTDRSATDHMANPSLKPYICSPCPEGFVDVADKCEDVNECNYNTLQSCSQDCVNTQGSYHCVCNDGYRLNTAVSGVPYQCVDINECDEATSGCDQICDNTPPGSFTCGCYDGYIYNMTTKVCDATSVAAICLTSGIDCSAATGCTANTAGDAICFCSIGYQLNGDNSCSNIDECAQNVCSQDCVDSDGSYTCTCYTGYELNTDKTSCSVCLFPTYGDNCMNICACQHGTCDPAKGCICDAGWTGIDCDTDVDECQNANICGDLNTVCVNNQGSYSCDCRPGYTLQGGSCTDVNECVSANLNTCNQVCNNTEGGFTCSCNSGYLTDSTDPHNCVDFDECKAGVSGCDQICVNVDGRFNCECNYGFIFNDGRRTCSKVFDPCELFPDANCSDICLVVGNAALCSCSSGYKLATDGEICIDINECDPALNNNTDTALNANQCSQPDTCMNNVGWYICSCSVGYKLENDLRTCTACDAYHYGENCATECGCGVGKERCDSITGCVCKPGWSGLKCDEDMNECSATNYPCTAAHTECVNNPGSYTCSCVAGYALNKGGDCEDVNECSSGSLNYCSQQCTDTEGSYVCSCHPGFQQSGSQCTDINECSEGTDTCLQQCTNTDGNYRCSCFPGYSGTVNDCTACFGNTYGDQCFTSCNCTDANTKVPLQSCNHITGVCECTDFWTGTRCETDVDECTAGTSGCDTFANQGCHNTDGGYECSCFVGFVTSANGTCVESQVTTTPYTLRAGEHSLEVFVSFDYTIPATDDLTVNMTYYTYVLNVRDALMAFFTARAAVINIIIIHISRSLNVKYTVVVADTDTAAQQLSRAVHELATGSKVTLSGTETDVTDIAVGGVTVYLNNVTEQALMCLVYQKTIGHCSSGYECVIDDDASVPLCRSIPLDDNFGLLIGLGVGLPVFFLLILVVIMIVIYVRKRRGNTSDNGDRLSFQHGHFPSAIPTRINTSVTSWPVDGSQLYDEGSDSLSFGSGQRRHRRQQEYDNYRLGRMFSADDRQNPNFSWDFLHNYVEPNERYKIQRPQHDTNPHPLFMSI